MSKSIDAFLRGIMLAASQRMGALVGPSQQVIDTLKAAGYLNPDRYSGRVLSWLVQRTPLFSRTAGNPVAYTVQLDWFFRPPQECLDHHRLRQRHET